MGQPKGNCHTCKHKEIEFFKEGSYENRYRGTKEPAPPFLKAPNCGSPALGDMYCNCLKGKSEMIASFYGTFGHRTPRENEEISFSCFELPDHIVALDNLIEETDEVLEYLRQKSKND